MPDTESPYSDREVSHDELENTTRQTDQAEESLRDLLWQMAADVRQWADEVGLSIAGIRRIHKTRVEEEVAAHLSKLEALSLLDEETRGRLKPAVADAEECLTRRDWLSTLFHVPHLSEPLSGLLTLLTLGGISAVFIISTLSFHLNADSLGVAIGIAAMLLFVRGMIHAFFWGRLRSGLRVLTAVALVVGTIELHHWWGPALADLQHLNSAGDGQSSQAFSNVRWPDALHAGMWFAAASAAIGLVETALAYLFRRIVDASTYRKSSPLIQTALLIDHLLEVAYVLETKVQDQADGPGAYLSGKVRGWLVDHLELIANRVTGPWSRSLKTGHRSTDEWITSQARAIAVAIRRWQPRAALGGSHLRDMREAFTIAVVNACDGDWHLLAAETTEESESVGKRILGILRRLAIIPVPFLLSLLAVKYFSPVPAKYHAPIVLVGFGASLTYLLTSLDSKFADMLSSATRLTEVLRK
jgi:hypothetical protein